MVQLVVARALQEVKVFEFVNRIIIVNYCYLYYC